MWVQSASGTIKIMLYGFLFKERTRMWKSKPRRTQICDINVCGHMILIAYKSRGYNWT